MIGGLQGGFGDLDIKYLKQNISRCWSEISGSFRKNSVALYIERKTLRVSAIRGPEHVCSGKLKRPPLPSGVKCRMGNIRRSWNVDGRNFGCEISGEGGKSAG